MFKLEFGRVSASKLRLRPGFEAASKADFRGFEDFSKAAYDF